MSAVPFFAGIQIRANPEPTTAERRAELGRYLREMQVRYGELFCGDTQVLGKLKAIIVHMDDPGLAEILKALLKTKNLRFLKQCCRVWSDHGKRTGFRS